MPKTPRKFIWLFNATLNNQFIFFFRIRWPRRRPMTRPWTRSSRRSPRSVTRTIPPKWAPRRTWRGSSGAASWRRATLGAKPPYFGHRAKAIRRRFACSQPPEPRSPPRTRSVKQHTWIFFVVSASAFVLSWYNTQGMSISAGERKNKSPPLPRISWQWLLLSFWLLLLAELFPLTNAAQTQMRKNCSLNRFGVPCVLVVRRSPDASFYIKLDCFSQ